MKAYFTAISGWFVEKNNRWWRMERGGGSWWLGDLLESQCDSNGF
jgi:hypothetical protein